MIKKTVLSALLFGALVGLSTASKAEPKPFQSFDIYRFGLVGTHTIALTFDDGPGKGTERVLNLLKKYNIKATFFEIGENFDNAPDLPKRIIAEGHLLGNHTWDHPNLMAPKMMFSPSQVRAEITKTDEKVRENAPAETHIYFRAPFGAWLPPDASAVNGVPRLADYVGPIYWDVGGSIRRRWWFWGPIVASADWQCWDNNVALDKCEAGYLKQILKKDGGVILSHDSYAETATMWEDLLPKLIARGFKFVTLDQVAVLTKYRKAADGRHEEAKAAAAVATDDEEENSN